MQIKSSLLALSGRALQLLSPAPFCADTYPRQPGVDIIHYAFQLTLRDDTDVIEGEATVEFRALQAGVSTLTLDLVQPKPIARDRGMTVNAVTEAGKAARFEHAADRLVIHLEPDSRPGERRAVLVRQLVLMDADVARGGGA